MRRAGVALGRLAGVEVRASASWALLAGLVVFLGWRRAEELVPAAGLAIHLATGVAATVVFTASLLAHELAHALVGRRLGAPPEPIVLGFLGAPAPGGIRASGAGAELAIALAGPTVSLLAGAALWLVALPAAGADGVPRLVAEALRVAAVIGVVLAGVSAIPAMPLDGGRALRAVAWLATGDPDRAGRFAAAAGSFLGWAFIAAGASFAVLGASEPGLVLVSLGWLVGSGSRTLGGRLELEILLRGLRIADAMRVDVPRVTPQITVDVFAGLYEGPEGVSAVPVVDGEVPLGVVGVRQVRPLRAARRAALRAAEVMLTPPAAPHLVPEDPLWSAVETLHEEGLDGLLVAEAGRYAGILTVDGLREVVRTRAAARAGLRLP